jgi:hypothetical protein
MKTRCSLAKCTALISFICTGIYNHSPIAEDLVLSGAMRLGEDESIIGDNITLANDAFIELEGFTHCA